MKSDELLNVDDLRVPMALKKFPVPLSDPIAISIQLEN